MPGTHSKAYFRRPGLKAQIVRLLRAAFVGTVIFGAVIAGGLSSAKARLGESLMAFGDEFARWTNGKLNSSEGRLNLNGVVIHRITVTTPLGVRETLDRLQQVCRERGGVENAEASLKSDVGPSKGILSKLADGTYRHEGKSQGVLACIETGGPLRLTELVQRLQDFGRTGNLAAVGKLRYVLARREADVTSLLVLWTEGDAQLLQMFPQKGDAPGQDVPDVPRPEHARRLLSALEQGSPYAVTVYRAQGQSPASSREWYEHQLQSRGWRVSRAKDEGAIVARRAGRTVVVRSASKSPGSVTISVVELS